MARKKKQEEQGSHERWLVSYADFITLLFAFFVVMYSVSSVNEGKYRVLSESMEASFRSSNRSIQPIQIGAIKKSVRKEKSHGTSPIVSLGLANLPPPRFSEKEETLASDKHISKGEAKDSKESKANKLTRISKALEDAMRPLVKQGLIDISKNDEWIEVEISSSILFPSGEAQLSRQSIPVLEKIAKILGPTNASVHVEGFTDNVPINNIIYPSNWELSAARAASVVHLFTKTGVNPKRLAATGFGEYQPLSSNSTAAGRKKNRRVVLIVNSNPSPRIFIKKKPNQGKSKNKSEMHKKSNIKESTLIELNSQKENKESSVRKGTFRVLSNPIQLPGIER